MSGRVSFICNDVPVDVEVAGDESLLSVLRERLGITVAQGRLCPAGPVRMLHGAGRRRGRASPASRPACGSPAGRSPRSKDSSPNGAAGLHGVRRDAAVRNAASARPGSSMRAAALLAKGPHGARRRSTARSLRISVGAPAGRRSTRRSRVSGPACSSRPRSRTPRRRERAGGWRGAAASRATCRSARAVSPTTARHATRSSRSRCPRGRRRGRGAKVPRACDGSSRDASEARAARPRRSRGGARRSTNARRFRSPRSTARRRPSRDELGRARISRARRVVVRARRRAGVTAGEWRRVRRQAGVARRRGGARARRRLVERCASCSHARTSCVSGRSGRRSPRRRVLDGDVVRCGESLRVTRVRSAPRSTGRTRRLSTRSGRRTGAPGPPVARTSARSASAEQAVLVEGALAEAGVDRAALVRDDRGARCRSARGGRLRPRDAARCPCDPSRRRAW